MRFSERLGYRPPQPELSVKSVSDSLRAGLWDACRITFFEDIYKHRKTTYPPPNDAFELLSFWIWFDFYREPADERPNTADGIVKTIRERFFEYGFPEIYDFIEFMANLNVERESINNYTGGAKFAKSCNGIFEREKAAFRFCDTHLIKITQEEEIDEIKLSQTQTYALSVAEHIKAATTLYSDRNNPDYRNSIKESISAVEAACNFVSGTKNSGVSAALQKIEEMHGLHPAFKDGLKKIYGYTSNAKGIRHALTEAPNTSEEDARFMLVICSAFSNYLISLKIKGQ